MSGGLIGMIALLKHERDALPAPVPAGFD
jgi:hypothetical protein